MENRTLVTVVALIAVFILGFFVAWMLFAGTGSMMTNDQDRSSSSAQDANTSGGQQVNAASLSEGQRQMLESFGIDPDSITITPEMIACAETRVGAARVAEIQNGATPSFTEGMQLAACYRGQ